MVEAIFYWRSKDKQRERISTDQFAFLLCRAIGQSAGKSYGVIAVFICYKGQKYCLRLYMVRIMNTRPVQTRRKNIDIREDVYRFLSIKATEAGMSLKSYIEALIEKDV